jgi:hypothetical protein
MLRNIRVQHSGTVKVYYYFAVHYALAFFSNEYGQSIEDGKIARRHDSMSINDTMEIRE